MELSELIESVDILEYISQFTEFTEKNGEYWALSPLKEENTPSFSIRKEENTFYDFSSGVGGSVLTFIRHFNKCSWQEAIEKLKEYAGCRDVVAPRKKLSATEVAKRFAKPKKAPRTSKGVILSDDYMDRYEKETINWPFGSKKAYPELLWINSRYSMTNFLTAWSIQSAIWTEKS